MNADPIGRYAAYTPTPCKTIHVILLIAPALTSNVIANTPTMAKAMIIRMRISALRLLRTRMMHNNAAAQNNAPGKSAKT